MSRQQQIAYTCPAMPMPDRPSTTLLGFGDSDPLAIAYAARYPERVSHLMLWCSYAREADYLSSPTTQAELALGELRDIDWATLTETWGHPMLGWSEDEEARRLGAFVRECVTPEGWQSGRMRRSWKPLRASA